MAVSVMKESTDCFFYCDKSHCYLYAVVLYTEENHNLIKDGEADDY